MTTTPTPPAKKLRILVVTALYPPHHHGGYELRCRQVVEAMRARGHTVQVLTSNYRKSGVTEEPGQGAAPDRSLRNHNSPDHPPVNIWKLHHLELHNNRRLREVIAEFKPDVVQVSFFNGLSKSFLFTLARLGVPVQFDVSDHWIARIPVSDVWLRWWNQPNPSLPARVLRTLWTVTGRRAAWDKIAPTNPLRHARFPRLFFCSAALRELTSHAGMPVAHGQVIHCPVDLERFKGPPPAADHPVRRLLFVGRVVADKGVMTALQAMRKVQGAFDGSLTICGKGEPDYEASLKAFVKEHNLPVNFTSSTSAGMPDMYRSHDALLFTSEWEEPFALTPLEAMGCGLPVIGTMTGGSKELLRHGENALTYQAGDSDELARRIRELAADPARARQLVVNAQAELPRLSEPVIMDQIEQHLYETIATWKPVMPPRYDAA